MLTHDQHQRLSELTERESEVLKLFCAGLDDEAIAKRLIIAEGTVRSHLYKVRQKLGVNSPRELSTKYCHPMREEQAAPAPSEETAESRSAPKRTTMRPRGIPVREPKRRNLWLWWLVGVIAVLCLAVVVAVGIISAFPDVLLGDKTREAATATEVERAAAREVTVEVTNTPTPVVATDTSRPPEPTVAASLPIGDWAVRAYRADDANMIVVNQHLVGGIFYGGDTGSTNINGLLQDDAPNYVTFINMSHYPPATWGFSVEHNGVVVWGNEGEVWDCRLCYIETVEILPDDTVREVNLRHSDEGKLGGSWSARARAADFGVLTVNGASVTAAYSGIDAGWVDIGGMLNADQNNVVTVSVWNDGGDYSWDFVLRKGETVVWGSHDSGSGPAGEIFFTSFVIDGNGNIVR